MPNTRSAKKRLRQNVKRRTRNRSRRSRLRTAMRGFREALEGAELEAAPERLKEALSLVDRGVKQGILHRNAAARQKSRLTKRLNAALAASSAGEPAAAVAD